MASYKIIISSSRLGAEGSTVTDADLAAAQVDAGLLIASGVIAPASNQKPKTEPETQEA